MSVRNESPVYESCLPKVRLISQPDFGHALREAQLTIANLSGRVTQAEISEREAKGLIHNMRERIESLEGEVNELQEAESVELQRLGSQCTQYFRENSRLIREISLKDLQMKSMENVLMNSELVQYPGAYTSSPEKGPKEHSHELRTLSSGLADAPVGVHVEEIKSTQDTETESMLTEGTGIESKATEDVGPGQEDVSSVSSYERESSLLRDLPCSNYKRLLYPIDAVSDREAQKWFPQAFHLVNVDLGSHYMDFLGHWINFERLHGWGRSGGRLTGSGRPSVISKWVKEGRYPPRCSEPCIDTDELEQYTQELSNWWKFIRPTTPFDRDNMGVDWVALNKHGINGWLSIVVGMKWWGRSLEGLTGDSLKSCTEEWLTTLEDLIQTLQNLQSYLARE